ncbi:MAG TPA: gluconokinase [Abditibacteriaceae bacterium]|jgi:gluconokinase
MPNFHVLALDIGTSSARALLFDSQARAVGEPAQTSYDQTTTHDGGVECDADELFELTARCIDNALKVAPQGVEIGAVACSCFWHSLLAVDAGGRAISPVFSWADNRAAPWVAPLRATLDEVATHARTGCVFHTSYWPAKLLWLHFTRPEWFNEDVRWMSFGEYIALRVLGTTKVSLSMASGTGLFHQNNCDWDDETLKGLPIGKTQLSQLCDANESLGEVAGEWLARWPQLQNARWYPALGDGACSNLGSGGVDDKHLVLNVGTSAAVRVVLENFSGHAPHGLWRYRVDKKRSIMGGAVSNAGNVFAWAKATLRLPDDVEAQLAAMKPAAHGLTVLPFLAGERSPLWNANARWALEGASLDTTPEEILRASLEAASLRFAAIAHLVQGAMNPCEAPREILCSGGAFSKSPAWAQISADCMGANLVESCESEASARGAALMALEACGIVENIADLPAERGAAIAFNPDTHEIYNRALERQNAFYDQLFASSLMPRTR